jgi:hypothetical protein
MSMVALKAGRLVEVVIICIIYTRLYTYA